MILGAKRPIWTYDLAILNSLVKIEDILDVRSPIRINVWAIRRQKMACWLCKIGAFVIPFLLLAMIGVVS